jgi:hypothetical protein
MISRLKSSFVHGEMRNAIKILIGKRREKENDDDDDDDHHHHHRDHVDGV